MAYSDDILKLRNKVASAVELGVFDPSASNSIEAILIQIMNEAEKSRQQCSSQAESLRKEASKIDGQAFGFSSIINVIYNVLNGYISLGEKAKREEDARLTEKKLEEEDKLAELKKITEAEAEIDTYEAKKEKILEKSKSKKIK